MTPPQPPDRSTLGFDSRRPYVDPVIEAYKKDVDWTLTREMLKLTPEQRILRLQRALEELVELQNAMKAADPVPRDRQGTPACNDPTPQ